MTRCSFCLKNMGFREDKVTFQNADGLEFCLDCMTCSICDSKGQKFSSGILGMTPLCLTHFEKYNRVLPLVPVTEWPEETPDARLKYLYRVKNRDTKLLTRLENERPKKIDDIAGETIALVGNNFRGVSFLRLSEIKSNDKLTVIHERIGADLRDCVKQISEVEALKQN